MFKKYDAKGYEISDPLKVPLLLHVIETPEKTANMVKALTAVNMQIDPDYNKGFMLSPIKE